MEFSNKMRTLRVVAGSTLALGLSAGIAGVGVSAAGAAKGAPKVQNVQGSISGSEEITGHWSAGSCDPMGGGMNATFDVVGNADVQASYLGRGTIVWNLAFGPMGGGSSWAFTSQNSSSPTLGGFANVQMGPSGGASLMFNVQQSNSGKFAGVNGGQLQTLPQSAAMPQCDPSDTTTDQTVTITVPVHTTIYGQLLFL